MNRIGPFEIRTRLGTGGVGEVWLGLRHGTGAPVAVKVLRADRYGDPELARLMRAEIRTLAGLDHPHIAVIFDAGTVGDGFPERRASPYVAMEYLPGSLSRQLPQTWAETRARLLELLDGLAHAHARELVHRDLKPGNLLLDGQGRLKIVDFGIAHHVDIQRTERRLVHAGTPSYMPPSSSTARGATSGRGRTCTPSAASPGSCSQARGWSRGGARSRTPGGPSWPPRRRGPCSGWQCPRGPRPGCARCWRSDPRTGRSGLLTRRKHCARSGIPPRRGPLSPWRSPPTRRR